MRRSERVSFQGGSGFELAGIIDRPENTPVGTAIFTHCFTCSKDLKAIVRISRGLAARGFCVLRYDLTGLGNSRGEFSKTNFSSNQADLLAAAEFMSTNVAPVDMLIGHSFGGACSLSLTQAIESVKAIISLAAPSDTHHLARLLNRMDPAIEATGSGEVTIGGRTYQIDKQMLDDFKAFDLTAVLRNVTKPCLILHSPTDETLGFDHAQRLYGLLTQRGPDDPPASLASLVCLPNSDHLLVSNQADLPFVADIMATWAERMLHVSL